MRVSLIKITLLISTLVLAFGMGCRGDTPASLEPVGDLQYINLFGAPTSLNPGETASIVATGYYPGNASFNVTGYATWTSSNYEVIQFIGQGIIRAVGGGTAVISCSYSGVTSQTIEIFVTGMPGNGTDDPPQVVLSAIQVDPVWASVAIGESEQFSATAIYSNGTTMIITNLVDWRVSDDDPGFIIDADNANAWGPNYGLFKATGPLGTTVVSCVYMGLVSNYVTVIVKEF